MDYKEFESVFSSLAAINGIDLTSDAVAQKFFSLSGCLAEANKIHNLTAIKEEKDVILKHFIDSLMISGYIPQDSEVVDVGCGPGFPSLPLAVYRDDVSVVGIDSTAKKINYVNETAKTLGLSNIRAISARAEELAKSAEYREKFDVATARAVASLPVLCELCLPFVKEGGLFIAMKAQNPEQELSASLRAIDRCGGAYYKTIYKELADENGNSEKRSLIIIKKIGKTPENYPRIYSKIIKKPL